MRRVTGFVLLLVTSLQNVIGIHLKCRKVIANPVIGFESGGIPSADSLLSPSSVNSTLFGHSVRSFLLVASPKTAQKVNPSTIANWMGLLSTCSKIGKNMLKSDNEGRLWCVKPSFAVYWRPVMWLKCQEIDAWGSRSWSWAAFIITVLSTRVNESGGGHSRENT